ncbi:MAG TPA: glycosyltransferase family 2 protein [Patescibacteria group bacterium]
MPKKISAVILNYKHPLDTIKCIKSLKKSDLGKTVDYYIVDNSPTEKVEKQFKQEFPSAVYISSPSNPGFAGGNNLAIRQALKAGSEYVLIINPDVVVGQDFFSPLIRNFSDKKVGVVAPAILHSQKGEKMYGLEGKVDWHLAKPEHINSKSIKDPKPKEAEFVTFACVLISRDAFEKAGLLDEGYFMYYEDVDYCLSVARAGKKIILDPSVVVSHESSSSFSRPTDKLWISFKSNFRFINKWLSPENRIIPYLYALVNYPYLYLLWTYHEWKYR